MQKIYFIGVFATPVSNWADKSFKQLVREAYLGVLADSGMENGHDIETCWFSNLIMDYWGAPFYRGQICMSPLVRDGLFPPYISTTNVEAGCASGSLAMHGAWKDIASGQQEVSLAIGVEKMYDPKNRTGALKHLDFGLDPLDRQETVDLYIKTARDAGAEFLVGPERAFTMDFYNMIAANHMKKYGTTVRQMACAAANAHQYGCLNPRGQYKFNLSVDDVLNDRNVSGVLTRAMCSPIGDAAAAALLCSEKYLKRMPKSVQDRAILIKATACAGNNFNRTLDQPFCTKEAADRAYKIAGVAPKDIDVFEVHDATSFSQILAVEDMGLCPEGQGGPFIESGATRHDGDSPVNLSGGLISRGHPIGATGIIMVNELALQLRGEAGPVQVPDARLALQENGGGLVGLDAAVAHVMVLERNR